MGDTGRFNLCWLTINTSRDTFVNKTTIFVELGGSISNNHVFFLAGIDIDNFISYLAVFNDAIWCLDEAIFVDTGIGSKVKYETDVTTFRSFNSTDTAVVSWVSITDIEAGAFTS